MTLKKNLQRLHNSELYKLNDIEGTFGWISYRRRLFICQIFLIDVPIGERRAKLSN